MIEGLVFEVDGHRYTYHGKALPSVTRVLKVLDNFAGVPPEVLDFAAQRGTAVHEATALDDNDDLDEGSIDPIIAGYVAAWRDFKAKTDYAAIAIELPVVHGRLEYAGTLDRVCFVSGKCAVVDIKTGLIPLSAGPQLAAYREAYDWMVSAALVERPPEIPKRRYVVQLRQDGTFRLEKYDSPEDLGVFRSALEIRRWLEKNAG